jgi:hypothetical protein
MHHCGVCYELEGNKTPNPTAKFCGVCGVYICDECRPNLLRRAMAMGIRKDRKLRAARKLKELREARKAAKQ